jgi:hypothetical protein
VRYSKEKRQWQAYVLDDEKVNWLGFYDTEVAAAQAHDSEALCRFGAAADLNFGGGEGEEAGGGSGTKGTPPVGRWAPGVAGHLGFGAGGETSSPELKHGFAPHTGGSSKLDSTPPFVPVRGRPRKPKQAGGGDLDDLPYQPPGASARQQGAEPGPLRGTKFRGVLWDESAGKWQIQQGSQGSGQTVLCGAFDSDVDAAKAYDAAITASGRKERLNFPLPSARNPNSTGIK